ncbi:MAG: tRNA lysidine(34) synthetase TilS [bacterium]|nr:tRNA lysidine(34) synthetase TilS [bacterium]
MKSIEQQVYVKLKSVQAVTRGDTLVVGVSGGADSLALLHILLALSAKRFPLRLHVASLDHGLRGEAGAADVEFVRQTAEAWGLPVTTGRVDVGRLAEKHGVSIETAARNARYDFLAAAAREVGAKAIVVGHHADDQAETILMHLLRGAGVRGLSGMSACAAVPGHADLLLLRPLLGLPKSELQAYCDEHGLMPREDETNQDVDYTRNAVRYQVMPALKALNPQVVSAFQRFAEVASSEDAYVEHQFIHEVEPHLIYKAERVMVRRDVFQQWHPVLQRRALIHMTETVMQRGDTLSHERIQAAQTFAQNGAVGGRVLLPGKAQLRMDYEYLVMERLDALADESGYVLLPEGAEITIPCPGVVPIPATDWLLHVTPCTDASPPPDTLVLSLPKDAAILLRGRRAGDVFQPMIGGGHHKTLKRWMIDQKIPHALRERLPVLLVNGEVAAILNGQQWEISVPYVLRQSAQSCYMFSIEKFINSPM